MNNSLLHPNFTFNGKKFTGVPHLKTFAQNLGNHKEAYIQNNGEFILDWLSTEDFITVKTSGSTGTPKNITLLKTHMINSAKATANYFNLPKGTKALLCLPTNYIAGKMMLVRAMVQGWQLCSVNPSATNLIPAQKMFDFGAMVPMQAQKNVSKLAAIKTLILGGAAITSPLRKQLKELPTTIFETYGMTETITHIAVKPVEKEFFETLPHITLSTDTRNCLVIKAPKVANAPVVTNDIVTLKDQKHFKWVGRYDNIINSGGIKLQPEVIEQKLSNLIPEAFFVTGLPDEKLGEKLVLVVETAQDYPNLLQKVRENEVFARYEVPKKIFTVKHFVRTKTNKIDRNKTLELVLKNL